MPYSVTYPQTLRVSYKSKREFSPLRSMWMRSDGRSWLDSSLFPHLCCLPSPPISTTNDHHQPKLNDARFTPSSSSCTCVACDTRMIPFNTRIVAGQHPDEPPWRFHLVAISCSPPTSQGFMAPGDPTAIATLSLFQPTVSQPSP
jgi:hypothetical protein